MDAMPKSRAALARAIVRYAGNDIVLSNGLAVDLANAIVAQMIGAGNLPPTLQVSPQAAVACNNHEERELGCRLCGAEGVAFRPSHR